MSDIESIVGENVEIAQDAQETQETPAVQEVSEAPEKEEHHEQKVVPLAALHEERSRRKELGERLRAAEEARAEMERRVEARLAALQQAMVPPPPAPPSFDEDPARHLKAQLDALNEQQRFLTQQTEESRRAQAQAEQINQLAARVTTSEAEFVREAPDYQDAIRHLAELRIRELQTLGVDEYSAKAQSARELQEFAFVNASQGKNPAQIAYQLAKVRGYTPANAVNAEQKMAMQQKGAQASRSLGGGGSKAAGLSAQALLSMSDDEFAEATKGGNWAKLMGG